jgi:flagellar basal-body rod protein FlgC
VNYFRTMEICAAGMAAQKARLEAATLNIANMNTSIAPGTVGFAPLTAVIHSVPTRFSQLINGVAQPVMVAQAQLVQQGGVTIRKVYDPGHPDADAAGMVSYPAVDHTAEMMTVMTALRAYEANLAAMQTTKTLASKALEIGG